MSYQEVRLIVQSDRAEEIADILMEYGALSVAIEDAFANTSQEKPLYGEPGEIEDIRLWEKSLLILLFSDHSDIDDILKNAFIDLRLPLDHYEIKEVEEQDWVRMTQSQFDSIPISDRLWIVPSWRKAPNTVETIIKLDPGLAFGTGSHPTTHLCLQWLDKNIATGDSILDYGCGSGILAIAALKLGAKKAVGVDVDEQAIIASRFNAHENAVNAEFYLSDDYSSLHSKESFDVVIANILSNPLRILVSILASYTKQNGYVVLSGILELQQDEIKKLYEEFFEMETVGISEGWVCLAGKRR